MSHPDNGSVNDGIPDSNATVHYASTDDAITLIKKLGPGCMLTKLDIKSAFKIIPVHPEDHHLIGFSWENQFYYGKTLPMGCWSSCAIFELFSTAVEWIAQRELQLGGIVHILDDFLLMSTSEQVGKQDLTGFQALFKDLGIPLAKEKTEGPTTCLTFAGIEIDTKEISARLPADKLAKARDIISQALLKKKLTLRELQSIIGFLNFACKVVVPGRAFLRRLINLTIGIKNPPHHVRLTLQAKADLQAWLLFLQQFNGKSFFLSDQ